MKSWYIFRAKTRNQSHEGLTEGATSVCGGTFYSPKESEKRSVEIRAVAFEFQHLSREKASAQSEDTVAKLFSEKDSVQRGRCEALQRQKAVLLRQLRTDARKIVKALMAKRHAAGDGDNMKYLTIFYVCEQHALLIMPDELCENDVASARQGAIRD